MDGTPGITFVEALDRQAAAIAEACTRCGRCVEACPMTAPFGIDASRPGEIVEGVVARITGGAGSDAADRWASVCTNSGSCIPACPEGINPRFMLVLARRAMKAGTEETARRAKGVESFRNMSRGVRVLARLQLPPDLLARLGQGDAGDEEDGVEPDLVFYTGCNVLKTPHIALLALDVLEALGVRYRVVGGPQACCGVLQFRAGDPKTSGRVAARTIERLGASRTHEVLSWCPSCQVQLGEVAMPTVAAADQSAGFDLAPFVGWLDRNFDRLRPLLVHRVEKRVALHEHTGVANAGAVVRRILEAIPGLEFVDLEQPAFGHQCSAFEPIPAFKRDLHDRLLQAAADAGVTTLAGIYHACHRDLCSHERDWPFEVVNFLELIGAAMGIERPDLFKRLKLLGDVEAIVADTAELARTYRLDPGEVREVIIKDLLVRPA